jgi:hypothetical protein
MQGGGLLSNGESSQAAKQALSIADLMQLIGNEGTSVWSNEKGEGYVMPWEATLLTMMFAGRATSGSMRHDVALTIAIGRSLIMPSELQKHRPHVVFDGNSLSWTYEGKSENQWDNGAQLLQAIRNPGTANPGWCTRIGSLPAKASFEGHVEELIANALMGDQFEIFCIVNAYRKRKPESASIFRGRTTASDLQLLAKTANPEKYLAVIGDLGELLNTTDPL